MLSSVPLRWPDGVERSGAKKVHVLVLDNGKTAAQKYLDDLFPGNAAQEFVAALEKVIETEAWEQIGNLFKPMQHASNVWQVSGEKHRLHGFRVGDCLVLTRGFRKGTKEEQKAEVAKADELGARYRKENKAPGDAQVREHKGGLTKGKR